MSQPTYPTKCLACGHALDPVALDPDTAPWLCPVVHPGLRGYWACELSSQAPAYRSQHADFGFGAPAIALRALVDQEHAAAVTRGTSLREDQLGLVPAAVLTRLSALPPGDAAFTAALTAALAPRVAP